MIAAHLNRVNSRRDPYASYFVPPLPSIVSRTNGFPMSLPHTLFRPIFLLLALSLGAMTNASAQTRDVAGAKDYPGIGRFGGSVITGYQVKDFDAARMQGGVRTEACRPRRLEGRITRTPIAPIPAPRSEVSRNFKWRRPDLKGRLRRRCLRRHSVRKHRRAADPVMWVDVNRRHFAGARWTARDLCQPHRRENNREIYT
jgi:hypothetical protein